MRHAIIITNKLLVAFLLPLLHVATCSLMAQKELHFLHVEPGMIFLDRLKLCVTKAELRAHFKQFGAIESLTMYKNPSNRLENRGYAFLKYKDPASTAEP